MHPPKQWSSATSGDEAPASEASQAAIEYAMPPESSRNRCSQRRLGVAKSHLQKRLRAPWRSALRSTDANSMREPPISSRLPEGPAPRAGGVGQPERQGVARYPPLLRVISQAALPRVSQDASVGRSNPCRARSDQVPPSILVLVGRTVQWNVLAQNAHGAIVDEEESPVLPRELPSWPPRRCSQSSLRHADARGLQEFIQALSSDACPRSQQGLKRGRIDVRSFGLAIRRLGRKTAGDARAGRFADAGRLRSQAAA
mmetsp:Transcript_32832/g.94205  ORF Transcript_32832/g.94205 Transcript_32832/m.94205 type:complete len:257 (+) Transcript_32832:16-786(+)